MTDTKVIDAAAAAVLTQIVPELAVNARVIAERMIAAALRERDEARAERDRALAAHPLPMAAKMWVADQIRIARAEKLNAAIQYALSHPKGWDSGLDWLAAWSEGDPEAELPALERHPGVAALRSLTPEEIDLVAEAMDPMLLERLRDKLNASAEAEAARERQAERERDELRREIMQGEPDPSFKLANGNYVEMTRVLHAARQGAVSRAEAAEAEASTLRAKLEEAGKALERLRAYAASVWFDEATASDEEHELMRRAREGEIAAIDGTQDPA
jgi:hypothetical protein